MSAKRGVVCTVALGLFACSGSAPTAPDVGTEAVLAQGESGVFSASGGNSGCYTVKGKITGVLDEFGGPVGPLEISGDLVGTNETVVDFGTLKFAGVTIRWSGVTHWDIDGGVVPGLDEFKTAVDNKNLNTDRPGSPANVFENIGKHRALEGVEKSNLHYKGTSTVGPTGGFLDHDYQGVICP